MKRILLGLLLGCIPGFSLAFIYEVKVLRFWDQERNRYHFFIGFSDFHDKNHTINQDQLASLDAFLNSCDNKETKIILEDLSSHGSGGRNSCGRFAVNSRGGILGGLAAKCRERGFDVDNVEYRYCRVSALGPVLNNLDQTPHDFPSVSATPVMALALEVDAIIEEIATYNDGDRLTPHYQQGLDQVKTQMKKWKQKSCSDLSVAHYLDKHSTKEDRLELLKHLLTFDSSLVDLKMVHAIINARDQKTVLALSGGAHITRVVELLQLHGYELVYETEVQFYKEHDLKKCLGSNIVDGSYCIRPEPINLEAVKNFF